MVITLKASLERIEARERVRPVELRRKLPSMAELADRVGIHAVSLSKIVNGNVHQLNLETAGRIITVLRESGFDIGVTDFLEYVPPDSVS
jgi:DNA-binding Xre family transcriptional regulator